MFGIQPPANTIVVDGSGTSAKKPVLNQHTPYIPGSSPYTSTADTMNLSSLDTLLEKEKQHNKTETWNKLDKTVKIQKLHGFAEKYGREQGLPMKEVKNLKAFFVECLDKSKLQKTKDVAYDKETHEISSIPALFFNMEKRQFTLRIVDTKRVSTLKSLTPKRMTTDGVSSEP